jgi:beta-N-acetylhexosaminidase
MKQLLILFAAPLVAYGQWAEETLLRMSVDEKIGQVFVIPACELRESDHLTDLRHLIIDKHIGGVIFKQGTIRGQVSFCNALQELAPIPLLGMQDAEPGLLARRVLDLLPFPKNLALGAIQNPLLIEALGREIGLTCKKLGFSITLSPVVDVNSNPSNPIIGMRSFGDQPERVAECGISYLKGLESAGVFSCAKHFPGHGDTSVDSHRALPVLSHSRDRLNQIELAPFRAMIAAGVPAIMTAHLFVPAIDPNVPLTFSRPLVEGLLREELGFQGLIISDALNMKAVSGSYSPGEVALKTFLAGHDCLLYGDHIAPRIDQILRQDIPEAMSVLKEAFASGIITEKMLNEHVLRILQTKEKLGLHQKKTLAEFGAYPSEELIAFRKQLYQESMTLVRDTDHLLPLKTSIQLIHVGEQTALAEALQTKGRLYEPDLEVNDPVVLAIYDTSIDITPFINKLKQKGIPCVVVLFASPYALPQFAAATCLLMAYDNDPAAERAAAAVIRGTAPVPGHLPITLE